MLALAHTHLLKDFIVPICMLYYKPQLKLPLDKVNLPSVDLPEVATYLPTSNYILHVPY